jgi:hypothetical protein
MNQMPYWCADLAMTPNPRVQRTRLKTVLFMVCVGTGVVGSRVVCGRPALETDLALKAQLMSPPALCRRWASGQHRQRIIRQERRSS